MKTPEKNCEKKITRSNTWKNLRKKLKNLWYAGAISWVLLLSSCGGHESNLTKISKEHDDAVENITTQKEELKDAQEDLKDAQAKVAKEQQDLIDAQKKEGELRKEVQIEKINP